MEVCTKAAIDRKSTDRFSDSRNHRASEGLRFLKDDVWLSGDRQERFGSICNHLGRQHGGVEQRPRLVAAPSPWLSGIATDEKTGREENESAEASGPCSDAFLPRTSCNQCGHASSLQSPNWPELFNTNNSSRNEQVHSQPDNSGQWGHVIFEKLFDPTRTFPGLGHIYTTSRHLQRNSNISKNDPPAFGYLDPSAMMGEYLHNYRNFLMDLRMGMRRGKNYESQIMCGPLPPHQLPRPQSLPQQANSQQESRQHPHISELSPGLWSVLAEIASPQPQDLRMEFSRLMNVVTSLRMREIWTDKKQHHHQQQQQQQQQHARPAPQGHMTYSRHGFPLPDPVGHRRGVSELEDKSFFPPTTSARRHEPDEDCIDDILAMTSILTTMHVQSDSSGTSDAASFMSSFSASPLSLSSRDPALGSRYLPGIQKNYERLQNPFVPCASSRVSAGPTYAVGMHRSCEKVAKLDDDSEEDDDIAELIDSARIEMQMEEEEEQEEKQRIQLLIYQLEQSQKQAPVSGEPRNVEGQEVSDPLQEAGELEESGGSCQASENNEVPCPDAVEEAQRQEMFHHFQQQQLSSERVEALDAECDADLLENERQVRFVLRRSTVNHHLNQDLQQNIVATGDSSTTSSSSSFTSFSHAFHKWQKAYQTENRAGSDDGDERLSGLTVYVTPALGSFASPLPLHPSEQEGLSEVSELKYRLNADKKTSFSSSLPNAVEDDDEEFSAGHFLTEEECFENTNDSDKYVYNSPKMGALLKNTGGKIRILGSKSYAEAYSESAALLYPDDASMGDKKKDKECSPARAEGKDTEEKGKVEQGGQKDSKKKPVVVSVRPLSHATRRSTHSYLTQRHGSRHRQAQHKAHANKHRQGSQSTKGTEAEAVGPVSQSQCSQRPESNSDEKQRAAEILATHSTHETVPDTCVTFGQNSQGQRRSASDSDVMLHKGDANSIFQLADQSTGAGDSAAAFSMFATNIVYPSLATFQHQLIAQPHSAQGSSVKSKSSRVNLMLAKTASKKARQPEQESLAGSNVERSTNTAPRDFPLDSSAGGAKCFVTPSGPTLTGLCWWPPHLPVPKTVSFSAAPLHPCPHLLAGSLTSVIAAREPLSSPGPGHDLSAEGKIEWKLAKRQDRLETQGAQKIYDNGGNQSGDEFSVKEKAASAVAVTGLSTAQTGFFNCKQVKLCGRASSISDDLSSMESADEVDVSLNDINFCVGPTLEILNNMQSKHSTLSVGHACKLDFETGFANVNTEHKRSKGVSEVAWIEGVDGGPAATLAELAIVQDQKLVLQEDAEYFYSAVAAAALSPKSRSISDRELHTYADEGLAAPQTQVCLQDAHNADKYTASRLPGGQPLESDARNIHQKSAATEELISINRTNKESTSAPVKPGWLPLSSLLHSYYPPCKTELEEGASFFAHSTGAADTQVRGCSGCLRNECILSADSGIAANPSDSHACQTSRMGQFFVARQTEQEENGATASCGISPTNSTSVAVSGCGNNRGTSDGMRCSSGANSGERSAQKERILEEISAWFTDNPSMPCTSRQMPTSSSSTRRCLAVRASHRDSSVDFKRILNEGDFYGDNVRRKTSSNLDEMSNEQIQGNSSRSSPEVAVVCSDVTDSCAKIPERLPLLLETSHSAQYPEEVGERGQEVLGAVHCSAIESVLQSCVNHANDSGGTSLTKSSLVAQTSVVGANSRAKGSCAHSATTDVENVNTAQECHVIGNRLFSEVVKPAAESMQTSALASASYSDNSLAPVAESDPAGTNGAPTAAYPVRTDYLCNQHLIPEQFRKLIVPDLEKMMQLGKDRVWETSADASSSAQSEAGAVNPSLGTLGASRQDEKKSFSQQSQPQRAVETVSSSNSTTTNSHSTSHGIRITAEELFANYEAAVIGSRATVTRSTTVRDPPPEESRQPTVTSALEAFNYAEKKASDGSYSSAATVGNVVQKTLMTRDPRNITNRLTINETGSGAILDVKAQGQAMTARDGRLGSSQQLQQLQQQQQQQKLQQQHLQQQQQQQALSNSSQMNKGRDQMMATAAYYANTRLSDVMTYATTGASINIPGLPRIPILSPQAAAHNAFLLKANSMRPCLQPNLSVPPPGFIPLMPVPTGPTFHHGPGGFPVGPYFSPGIFHSPNFIAMAPHPSATATFMQQTKVNICTNVNINSNISTSFSVTNASTTNRNDNHNFIYTFNNHLQQRVPTSSNGTHTTTTAAAAAAAATSAGSSNAGDSGRKSGEPRSQCKNLVSKSNGTAAHSSSKASSSSGKTASSKPGSAAFSQRSLSGHGGKLDAGSASSATGRGFCGLGDESRIGGVTVQGRSLHEKTRGGVGTAQGEIGGGRPPRGSNTDNLIRVFPPSS